MAYLTVPISAKTIADCGRQIDAACGAGAEMLELRIDYLAEPDVYKLREVFEAAKKTGLPIIVTVRDFAEGGQGKLSEFVRLDILVEAIKLGSDFVDCELANFKKKDFGDTIKQELSENNKTQLIISAHNFYGKFKNLTNLYEQIYTLYPEAIAKVAYKANHINDCFEAFDILREYGQKAIAICMGDAGVISRVLAKKLNAFLTFASMDNSSTAPGQISIEQMKNLYHYDQIDSETELFGIIGEPVAHSISPAVHNGCFGAEKMNKLYLPLLLSGGSEEFNEFLDNVTLRKWLDFKGFSVTIPHKTNAAEYARLKGEYIEPLAVKIGATNTITIGQNERISCYNTDYAGAIGALTAAMGITKKQLHGKSVAIIGAGGVSRAVIAGLADVGAKITIYNRTVSKAQNLAMEFACHHAGLEQIENLDAEIIINCTSIGMHPNVNESPVPKKCLKNSMVVFDTVYNPEETMLLKDAAAVGAKTVSGSAMFIGQAAEQFKLFTHKDCPMETLCEITQQSLQTF